MQRVVVISAYHPKARSYHLLRGGSLKSRLWHIIFSSGQQVKIKTIAAVLLSKFSLGNISVEDAEVHDDLRNCIQEMGLSLTNKSPPNPV